LRSRRFDGACHIQVAKSETVGQAGLVQNGMLGIFTCLIGHGCRIGPPVDAFTHDPQENPGMALIIRLSENNKVRFMNRVTQKVTQKEKVDRVTTSALCNLDKTHLGTSALMMDVRRSDKPGLRGKEGGSWSYATGKEECSQS
jgi:hypothetical protein